MDALLTPSGIIGAIGIIAAGIALVLTSTVQTLRKSGEDLRARVGDLEKERDGLKVELAEQRLSHEATKADLEALKRVVTGETHWVAIEHQLSDHHREALSAWERILTLLHDIVRKLGGV